MLFQEAVTDVPVVLVGNKTDQWGDRMVTLEEGQRRSKEIGCVCFHEISVRESIEQVETSSKTVLIIELYLTKAVFLQFKCPMPLTL
jgi:GTPase SAR1 family protein